MIHRRPYPTSHKEGFTLLEMMLSIAVFLLLIASAFTLVGSTTELMAETSEIQNNAFVRHRFVDACRSAMQSTTSDSSLEFYYYDRGGANQDSYLTLVKAPGAFDFGNNVEDQITRVVLASELRPDGMSRIGVYYLTDADFDIAQTSNFENLQSKYLELVPRMRYLAWRFYDSRTRRWVQTLDGDLNTSLIELSFQTTDGTKPFRTVFYCLNQG